MEEEEIGSAAIPLEMKKLRACLRCALIKTVDQFYEGGCENCPFLRMDQSMPRVMESTTAYFEGMIALVNNEGSWVAKWQRIGALISSSFSSNINLNALVLKRIIYPDCTPWRWWGSCPEILKISAKMRASLAGAAY